MRPSEREVERRFHDQLLIASPYRPYQLSGIVVFCAAGGPTELPTWVWVERSTFREHASGSYHSASG